MKRIFWMALVAISLNACNSTKKSSSQNNNATDMSTQKGNLLDGTWEVNYLLPQAKSFADLYPNQKPTITFNAVTGQVSGNTGCNQFNGSYTTNENNLSIPKDLALTRKMCVDMAGEQAFLETLKKVNKYSVTEQGKTLNLIMGDMAILRATRK